MHPELLKRAESRAILEDRTVVSVIEQALAEFLAIPVLDTKLPQGPVELCQRCERGVMWKDKCPVCGGHGRAERTAAHARAPD